MRAAMFGAFAGALSLFAVQSGPSAAPVGETWDTVKSYPVEKKHAAVYYEDPGA